MCEDDEIDAVMVATPKQVHVPVALEAVKHGKNVLVTKPLSDSEEAARELVEAAGVVNMMSLGMRFSDSVIYLRGLIEHCRSPRRSVPSTDTTSATCPARSSMLTMR